MSKDNYPTRQTWKQNPDEVRSDILRVATKEFAANGLSGARIDEIAAKTRTSKRMIYYYFGDKEGLYRQVLEAAYKRIRGAEDGLDLGGMEPRAALARLVEFTFDHHARNPEFIRLVMIENIHCGKFLRKSELIRQLNRSAIDRVADIYCRGCDAGVFRVGLDPLELHWQISALSFFNVSNRATFSLLFGEMLFDKRAQARLRADTVRMVLRFVAFRD